MEIYRLFITNRLFVPRHHFRISQNVSIYIILSCGCPGHFPQRRGGHGLELWGSGAGGAVQGLVPTSGTTLRSCSSLGWNCWRFVVIFHAFPMIFGGFLSAFVRIGGSFGIVLFRWFPNNSSFNDCHFHRNSWEFLLEFFWPEQLGNKTLEFLQDQILNHI